MNQNLKHAILYKHCKSRVYNLEWCRKNEIVSFINWIYAFDDKFYLKRKKLLADQFLKEINHSLEYQYMGRHGKYWRVRVKGKEYGHFKTIGEAKLIRDKVLIEIGISSCE